MILLSFFLFYWPRSSAYFILLSSYVVILLLDSLISCIFCLNLFNYPLDVWTTPELTEVVFNFDFSSSIYFTKLFILVWRMFMLSVFYLFYLVSWSIKVVCWLIFIVAACISFFWDRSLLELLLNLLRGSIFLDCIFDYWERSW